MSTALPSVIKKAFSGLVPMSEVRSALVEITDVADVADFSKKIEAARKYDSDTSERRNYWGELAVWSERRIGVLLIEAKATGMIREGGKGRDNSATVAELLKTDTDAQAAHISSRSQKLAAIPEEEVAAAIEDIKAEGEEVSKSAVRKVASGVHVANNSGEQEWYTPVQFLDAARDTMGRIDLDPASSKAAQKNVKAKKFYTVEQDGLTKPWGGTVWLNPPYASGVVEKFAAKLCAEFTQLSVTAAIMLTNNATETKWFHASCEAASAACFPSGRIKYLNASGEPSNSPLQGQVFLYFGELPGDFIDHFSQFGVCMEVHHS